MTFEIRHGESLALLGQLDAAMIDAVVTDPPYHLTENTRKGSRRVNVQDSPYGRHKVGDRGFMGANWDGGGIAFDPAYWAEVLRVCKPGAHLVAFGGSRTYHRLTCAIEDAGWQIRDCLSWLYGDGFPKSLDVSKAIDKHLGAERRVTRPAMRPLTPGDAISFDQRASGERERRDEPVTAAAAAAAALQGLGTALKPAWESIILAQKGPDLAGLCAILAHKIAEALWRLRLYAKDAALDSPSRKAVLSEEPSASALWSAVEGCSTPAALFDLMATWPSGSETPLSLSIAWSWLDTLAAISAHENTFTIETKSSLTTDLRTLNSSPFKITPATIIEAAISGPGTGSSASLAAAIFSGVRARLFCILVPSALGPATSPDEGLDLRPNFEPIVLARKPLIGTVAANMLEYGTGALAIDPCRIPTDEAWDGGGPTTPRDGGIGYALSSHPLGRWPANVLLDEDAAKLLDEASGTLTSGSAHVLRRGGTTGRGMGYGSSAAGNVDGSALYGDSGGASRFFYTSKASSAERHYATKNTHPTVKPVDLMRWLCRLVTPKGGLILDPFTGSGSTGVAALSEGFRFLGFEREAEYVEIARRRIAGPLFADQGGEALRVTRHAATAQLGLQLEEIPQRRRAGVLRSLHLQGLAVPVPEAIERDKKAGQQDRRVLEIFRSSPGRLLTPSEVHGLLCGEVGLWAPLLTSIRRSLTNLTKRGELQHWSKKRRPGPHGVSESCWSLA